MFTLVTVITLLQSPTWDSSLCNKAGKGTTAIQIRKNKKQNKIYLFWDLENPKVCAIKLIELTSKFTEVLR